jgi:hypothetical protein
MERGKNKKHLALILPRAQEIKGDDFLEPIRKKLGIVF